VRDPPAVEAALRAASLVGRVVTPDRLHALYQRVPARIRARVSGAPAAPVTAAHLSARDRAIRAFAARCAVRIAPSRWLARAAEAQGLGTVDVLPHGVDAPELAPRTDDAPDAPFVFLGTLSPHKGPDLVVEAHRRSGLTRPLHLYGPPGPDAAFAARFAARPLAQEEVWRALRGARALVMGSRWPENAPLVILEARAAGCPVIAPSIGGIPELLTDGRDGRMYAPGDVDALAACMRAIDADVPSPAPPPTFTTHLDGLAAVYTRAVAEAP
jgi:glycosyltransferase involved in cell wall biosynthesis